MSLNREGAERYDADEEQPFDRAMLGVVDRVSVEAEVGLLPPDYRERWSMSHTASQQGQVI
jgi:hypothetical protein